MKENTPNKTPIITLEVIAQRKAEKLKKYSKLKKKWYKPYMNFLRL